MPKRILVFYQVDSARSHTSSAPGLAAARQIAELHGRTFALRLPRSGTATPALEAPTEKHAAESGAGGVYGRYSTTGMRTPLLLAVE